MSVLHSVSRGTQVFLALSVIVAGAGFALPHLRPVPTGLDADLIVLRGERDSLAGSDDESLASLRQQSKEQPAHPWSMEKFTAKIGTGWRVEWQPPSGAGRSVLLTRSDPRLAEWPDYLAFMKSWTTEPGVALESLHVTANGSPPSREMSQVIIGLRITLSDPPIGNATRDAPSRVPLPVAAAHDAVATRRLGPVPSLGPPSASAKPPAPGQASVPVRPDPPGARTATVSSQP